MNILQTLTQEFNLKETHAKNIVSLLDEGNTVPFIARYRKEMTGACDDQILRELSDRLSYLRNLEQRKTEVVNAIVEQGKMTPEIQTALDAALTLTEVEDIYRPYKQKRKTRASVAIAKGLQPFADAIWRRTSLLTFSRRQQPIFPTKWRRSKPRSTARRILSRKSFPTTRRRVKNCAISFSDTARSVLRTRKAKRKRTN